LYFKAVGRQRSNTQPITTDACNASPSGAFLDTSLLL
jgi:hypothetical protein